MASDGLSTNSVLNDSFYREAIESSSRFNNRLVGERRLRLPFLDAQTGVAQNDCSLWMQRWDRMPGEDGQLYSYPAKRWKKKRRQYLMNERFLTRKASENETNESEANSISTETNVKAENNDSIDKYYDNSGSSGWLQDYEDADLPEGGEAEDPESDFDDYEEYTTRKKRKKKETPKRKRVEYSEQEKPYSCDQCGARYKTRPGLSYHYSHSHQNDGERSRGMDEDEMPYTPPRHSQIQPQGRNSSPCSSSSSSSISQPPPPPALPHPSSSAPMAPPPSYPLSQSLPPMSFPGSVACPSLSAPLSQPPPALLVPQHSSSSSTMSARASSMSVEDTLEAPAAPLGLKPLASPSPYCDFCLGEGQENKKTSSAEPLVSCSDCGRSAHPTCLQFTANMVKSVKHYRWQCIECKSCGLCGTSDNDDQLLFCDDCDRGYHMYCLNPPLQCPPEGSWSCHICIETYHTKNK